MLLQAEGHFTLLIHELAPTFAVATPTAASLTVDRDRLWHAFVQGHGSSQWYYMLRSGFETRRKVHLPSLVRLACSQLVHFGSGGIRSLFSSALIDRGTSSYGATLKPHWP